MKIKTIWKNAEIICIWSVIRRFVNFVNFSHLPALQYYISSIGNLIFFSVLMRTLKQESSGQAVWAGMQVTRMIRLIYLCWCNLGREREREREGHAGLELSYVLRAVLNRAPQTSRPPQTGTLACQIKGLSLNLALKNLNIFSS